MRSLVNDAVRPRAVAPPSREALAFHAALPGYRPTPLRELPAIAGELGLGAVRLKDESDRLGLPAFKILGAAQYAASIAAKVVGVEPVTAACVTASLAAGQPSRVSTPGTAMAGLDCAELSSAAWPSLRDGVQGMITIDDAEARAAIRELHQLGLAIGECGAAPLAALRALITDDRCLALRRHAGVGPDSRVLLIATEGPTDHRSYGRALE